MCIENTLAIDLDTFGFIQREESSNGKIIKNRCGRDFIYYALHYYYPNLYNSTSKHPRAIEESRMFGSKLPWWLMWTGLQFTKIHKLFSKLKIDFSINDVLIRNHTDFLRMFVAPRSISYIEAIKKIKKAIDHKNAVGVDLSLGLFGLFDHVMFVFAYDDGCVYVIDSHDVKSLGYEKITSKDDDRYIMKLPYEEIKKRWTRFGRVWILKSANRGT